MEHLMLTVGMALAYCKQSLGGAHFCRPALIKQGSR